MKATNKRIIAGIGLLAVAGIAIYLRQRQKKTTINRLKAEEVAEHGYETAHDILFPRRNKRVKGYRL